MRNIWIYQLESTLNQEQKKFISKSLKSFLQNWKAHGKPISSRADIVYDQFVVIKSEPDQTSGCSIDTLNQEVNHILKEAGVRSLESNHIFYRDKNGEIQYLDFRNMERAIREGVLSKDTVVFDSSIHDASELDRWEARLVDTWMSRFYN